VPQCYLRMVVRGNVKLTVATASSLHREFSVPHLDDLNLRSLVATAIVTSRETRTGSMFGNSATAVVVLKDEPAGGGTEHVV
jgi:hypothetical protein